MHAAVATLSAIALGNTANAVAGVAMKLDWRRLYLLTGTVSEWSDRLYWRHNDAPANAKGGVFNISCRKVGGICFLKIGRITVSFSVSKSYRPL